MIFYKNYAILDKMYSLSVNNLRLYNMYYGTLYLMTISTIMVKQFIYRNNIIDFN